MYKSSIVPIILLFTSSALFCDCDPQAYHETNNGQFIFAKKALEKLNFSGNESVLDIGSGDGRVSQYIAKHCLPHGNLLGIDKDSAMVEFANAHNKNQKVSFKCAVIESFVDGQYDCIVSFWTLHWVHEYESALQNITKILKPSGRALLCHIVGKRPLQRHIETVLEEEQWQIYKNKSQPFAAPSLARVAGIIEQCGLIIEQLEVKNNGIWMQVANVKKNFLSLALFDFIPEHVREAFCDEVIESYLTEYPVNENGEMYYWTPGIMMLLRKSETN